MLLLRVTDSRGGVTQHIAEAFPYRIGRSPQAHLRLQEPGVFDHHASIVPAEHARFSIQTEGESLLLRNGEPVRSAQLAPGDEFSIGSARILVSLAPARRKRLAAAEAALWLLLGGVMVSQVAALLLAK
jgi:hypothetical protein